MISIISKKFNLRKSFFNTVALAVLLSLLFIPATVSKAAEVEETATEPAFDAAFYASQYPDVVAAFGNDEQMLYLHYVNSGKAEGRFANAQEATVASAVNSTAQGEVANTKNDGVYNILAIGNSITMHPVCSYWWGSWGMAASSQDKDYIHQVKAGLEQTYETVNLDIISVQSWETSSARSKQLHKFDDKLANNYDLVIIQLGENVSNLTTFKKDFNKLVSYIKERQADAKIVIVGDYWYKSGRETSKISVATNQGCQYVDLSSIRGKKAYRASKGAKVLGDDGKLHTITNAAVISHPNDLGMEYIATKILEAIKQ